MNKDNQMVTMKYCAESFLVPSRSASCRCAEGFIQLGQIFPSHSFSTTQYSASPVSLYWPESKCF
jgi:hypothetical protein